MRAFIHRHLSYANVMATVAVFIALGGSALAAGYVITNSGQIKDGAVTGSDVKNATLTGRDIKDNSLTASDFSGSLQGAAGVGRDGAKGATGEKGEKGEAGAQGLQGLQGAQGDPGQPIGDLPSGKTLRGVYALESDAGGDQDGVTFPVPLPATVQAAFIGKNQTPPEACADGSVLNPQADAGWLCVWERDTWNRGYTLVTDESGQVGKAGTFGFIVFASRDDPGKGGMQSVGTWAVTAP